ncbi:hypothetical protein EK904_013353, partial [Melospiza melodia maxima]
MGCGLFCLSEFFLSSVLEQTQPNCPFGLASFTGVCIPDTAQPLCDGHRNLTSQFFLGAGSEATLSQLQLFEYE